MARLPSTSSALPRNTSPSVALAEFERDQARDLEGTVFDLDRHRGDRPEPRTRPEHSVVVVQLAPRTWIWECCQCGETGRGRYVDEALERAELAGHPPEWAVTL